MSDLKVKINYHAIATLSQGIKSQLERKDYNGLRGSVELLCKQLDKAALTAEELKNEKTTFIDRAVRRLLVNRSNRLRRRNKL